MKFTIECKLETASQIINNHGLQNNGTVETRLRDTVDRFCDPYIPFDVGGLKNNKRYPDNSTIEYISPHAHYHYTGKKAIGPSRPEGVKRTISNKDMKYQGAPKRGSKWDKRMMNDRSGEIVKDLEKFIENGGK